MIDPKTHPEYDPDHGDMNGWYYINKGEVVPEGGQVWSHGLGPWVDYNFGTSGKTRLSGYAPIRAKAPMKLGDVCLYLGNEYVIVGFDKPDNPNYTFIEMPDGYILKVKSYDLKPAMKHYLTKKDGVISVTNEKTPYEIVWNGSFPMIKEVS